MEELPKADVTVDADTELAELNTTAPELVSEARAHVEASVVAPAEGMQSTDDRQVQREQMAAEARAAIAALPDEVLQENHDLLASSKSPNGAVMAVPYAEEIRARGMDSLSRSAQAVPVAAEAVSVPAVQELPAKKRGLLSFFRARG